MTTNHAEQDPQPVSLLSRIDAALRFAVSELVLIDDDGKFRVLQRRLIDSALVDPRLNADTATGFSAVEKLTERVFDGPDGADINPIWFSPGFILPAIAAFAILLERTLNPSGDSRLTLFVERDESALYGYRLVDLVCSGLSYESGGTITVRQADQADMIEVTAHLVGAAYYLLSSDQGLRIGSRYLWGQISESPDSEEPSPRARSGHYILRGDPRG